MKPITVTRHAIDQYRRRSGETERLTEKLTQMVRRSKPSTIRHARAGREIRVFGDWLLIVHDDALITVFHRHRRSRVKAIRK